MREKLNTIYREMSEQNYSLDEILCFTYKKYFSMLSFEDAKKKILSEIGINEYEYYVKNVSEDLKLYVSENIFPEYEKNDQGHGILHIKEVIRRSFALNDTFKLNLKPDMIFTVAACHDLGKYIDHENHHVIASQKFYNNGEFKRFFSDEERIVIRDAIYDHRSSKEDTPRSEYGKLVSSADRNTTIEIVFIRSFFVASKRMPLMKIDDYLEYTIERLKKKYDENNPENMFYEDEIYLNFLKDMRELLLSREKFKDKYCMVNNIYDRNLRVDEIIKNRNFN